MTASRPQVVAIIPARRGSKGLPGKNVKLLAGKPLLAWSIESALASGSVDRVIVSTDDGHVAETARRWGAETPFLRPASLATDNTGLLDVAKHCMRELFGGVRPDVISLMLLPTSPFRPKGLISRLVSRLAEGCHMATTVRRVVVRPEDVFLPGADGTLHPLFRTTFPDPSTGALAYYRPYGLATGSWGDPAWPCHVEVVDDPAALIDIDSLEDFRLAEKVVARGLYPLGGGEKC